MTKYDTEAQAVKAALDAVYENKAVNKKDNISGDFSSDTESYPTVKAVKETFGNKVTNWSSTPSDSNYPSEKLVKNSLDGKASSSHTHSATEVTDANANNYTHIGTLTSGASQQAINSAIDTALSSLSSINAIVICGDISNRPTASVNTMGKLYICTESSKVNVYYTVENDGAYSWHKLDTDILDEYETYWNDIQNKPDSFTPSSHTHGNITNAGAIGSTSGLPIITTTDGVLTVGAFGTSSGTFAEGDHTHSGYTSVTDVDNEIEAYLDAIIAAYTPSP